VQVNFHLCRVLLRQGFSWLLIGPCLAGGTTVWSQPAPAGTALQPVLTDGLSAPVYLTNAHDGSNRLFIVERPGYIRVLQPGSVTPTLFMDISAKVLSGGEQGLLGLAFHPGFPTNRHFYVDYTRKPDGATVIAEYAVSAGDPNIAAAEERVLLSIPQPYANHNGGMVEFGPDGFLYIGMGDGGSGNDPGNRAQNSQELLGKILRIDVDRKDAGKEYSSPTNNPFFGTTSGREEIYALGLRNPWRYSFDRITGKLFVGDVGQDQVEEVDAVTLGGNYGWRVFEGDRCTNLDPAQCSSTGFIPPTVEYTHDQGRCSITGGYVYRGKRSSLPYGSYVFADYCTGEIFLLNDGNQSLLLNSGLNISSFGEDESGEIYVVGLGGTIHRIVQQNAPQQITYVIPRLVSTSGRSGGADEYTGIAVANPASDAADLRLTAYDRTGAVVSADNITNPLSLTLPGGRQLALLDAQIFGPGLHSRESLGWVKLESSRDVAPVFLNLSSELTSMDGTEVQSGTSGSLVLPELGDQESTEIQVDNPDPGSAQVSVKLINGEGLQVASVNRTLPGFGSLIESSSSLFTGLTPDPTDYIRVTSDRGIAVMEHIRGDGDERSLSGQDPNAGAAVLYCPQYVTGGPYRSTLSIINLHQTPGLVDFSLVGSDGVRGDFSRTVAIPANGKITISDQDLFGSSGGAPVQGYLVIRSNGVRLAGSLSLSGSLGRTFSTSFPLVSALNRSMIFGQVVSNAAFFTGVALANPGASEVHALMQLFDPQGTEVSSRVITIVAGGQSSGLLTEYFPISSSQSINSGYLRISADGGLAAYAVIGTNDLSILAAIPAKGN